MKVGEQMTRKANYSMEGEWVQIGETVIRLYVKGLR